MPENTIHSYKELVVWQKSVKIVIEMYELTEDYPKSELYGLTSQMQRAAVSIPSNIAEGRRRGTRKDFRHFLLLAYGSGAELETQIEISKRLPFGNGLNFSQVEALLGEVMRMLNAMINKLSSEATS